MAEPSGVAGNCCLSYTIQWNEIKNETASGLHEFPGSEIIATNNASLER